MNRKIISLSLFILLISPVYSQTRWSLSTDLGGQRNFKKDQKFWAIGPTMHSIFHFTPKDGMYIWYGFFSNGKFKNDLSARAKSPATLPQQINYTTNARMRLKEISLGWRKYFKGSPDIEKGWNLYSNAGFGLILGRIINTLSVSPDTSLYDVPVYDGQANFKRLTIDLGLGVEFPISGDFFIYAEGRVWIPTTDYPSKYIFVNNNAPFAAMLGVGIRTFF